MSSEPIETILSTKAEASNTQLYRSALIVLLPAEPVKGSHFGALDSDYAFRVALGEIANPRKTSIA
jgi:hypothetical protein